MWYKVKSVVAFTRHLRHPLSASTRTVQKQAWLSPTIHVFVFWFTELPHTWLIVLDSFMARIYIVCITVLSCFQYFHKLTKWLVFFFFFFFNAHLVVLNFPLFTSEMWGDICAFVCVYVYKYISNNSTVEGRKFELWISQLETPWGTNWVRRLLTWRDIFDVAHIYMYVLSKCTCHHFISISLVKFI